MDSSSKDSLWADYQQALLASSNSIQHELLGRTLRDVGWCRHAAFHYGMAFHQNPCSSSVGDYAQVLEFAGVAELGVLVLFHYRSGRQQQVAELNQPKVARTPSNDQDFMWLRQNPPPTSDCGCGHAECGRRLWFLDQSGLQPVVEALQQYQDATHQRMADDMPSTNNIHASLAKSKQIDISYVVSELLQFWKTSDSFVALEPVLQLLLVKLLYVTVPSLAAEAVIHLKFDSPRQLADDFKSHWAYYVMIRALVLGERIKRERRLLLGDSYPVPVWDLLWNKDRRLVGRDIDDRVPTSLNKGIQWNGIIKFAVNGDHKLPTAQWSLPSTQQHKPLFVIGDSHVLSIAWTTIYLPSDERRLVVPLVVTGLKAWHTRQETYFFAHSLLHSYLRRLPANNKTILLSAGEIDCREGIGGPLLEGYKLHYQDHVCRTVQEYVKAVSQLAQQYSLQVLVMPVAPHAHRSDRNGKAAGRAFRRRIMQAWNKELRTVLPREPVYLLDYEQRLRQEESSSSVGYVLDRTYNLDGTHTNSAILPHLEAAIEQSGCDLSLL